ncbi:uncharacterized protein LOC124381781 isoform X2 [Silurus meridionalis]|nr:uncharacterized protein LOC124381781 isoform X2 [Silurus meridionalis]
MVKIRERGGFRMAVPLLLLCCVCVLRTSHSYVVIQSPEVIKASVNASFSLKCKRDQLQIEYCYSSISWFKLNLRTGKLSEARNTGDDQQEDNKRSCVRTIKNAQIQDSGTYYCVSLHEKMVFIGTGTRVIITDSVPLKPSVFLYTPVEEADAPSVLLQCLVMDAVPSQISVWWVIGGEMHSGWTESAWTRDSDQAKEYTRAQIMVHKEEWIKVSPNIECVVKYGNQTVSKILQLPSHSDSTCTWLLFGGCSIAIITIAVVLTVALCLHKEKTATFKVKSQRAGVNPQSKYQAQGKQRTLKTNTEKTIEQVEYSCLNPEIFIRQPTAAAIEFNHQ